MPDAQVKGAVGLKRIALIFSKFAAIDSTFMDSEYVIFFNDRRFTITSDLAGNFQNIDNGYFLGHATNHDIPKVVEIFRNHMVIRNVFVGNSNVDELFASFTTQFKFLAAAGGLVQNEAGQYLMIYRRGKWDLPKGKVEPSETPVEAGVREVEEETGISGITVIRPLTCTYHTYEQRGTTLLKQTHWFLMQVRGMLNLKPQVEEDIEIAEWVDANGVENRLKDSYPSIRMVFESLRS